MGLKEWVPGCALDVRFEVLRCVGAALSLPSHVLGGTRGIQERADAFLNCGQCGGLSAPGCFSCCLPGPCWMPAERKERGGLLVAAPGEKIASPGALFLPS